MPWCILRSIDYFLVSFSSFYNSPFLEFFYIRCFQIPLMLWFWFELVHGFAKRCYQRKKKKNPQVSFVLSTPSIHQSPRRELNDNFNGCHSVFCLFSSLSVAFFRICGNKPFHWLHYSHTALTCIIILFVILLSHCTYTKLLLHSCILSHVNMYIFWWLYHWRFFLLIECMLFKII